jgi:multidrug resistance efflux pump
MKYLVYFVLLLVVVGGGYLFLTRGKSANGNGQAAIITDKVARRTVEKIVSANGKFASNRDVDIKCQASGTIKVLPYKDVSREVKPGEVLCQLDPIDMQRQLDTATAVVDADQARIAEAQLNREIALMNLETTRQRYEASLASAAAQAADAHAKAARTRQLFEAKPTALASKEQLDTAETTAAQADASLKSAKAAIAELEQQKKQIDGRELQIKQMQASLSQDESRQKTAKQNVDYCTVYAPVADNPADPPRWFISSLLTNIAPGYLVQSGTSGFSAGTTIMTLSDLSHVFLLASVDESDIGMITDPARGEESQPVRITADSFSSSNEFFEGRVVRVATKGVNSSNVVTFEVKIEITSENRVKLRPEMTGTAKIICAARPDVLAIPASAFTPTRSNQSSGDNPNSATAGAPASAPASGSSSRRGGGAGRGGRPGASPNISPIAKLLQPTPGTVSIVKDDQSVETRDVVVGLLGSDPVDRMTSDVYEVISGLSENETVLLKGSGSDSRWRNGQGGARVTVPGVGGGRGR